MKSVNLNTILIVGCSVLLTLQLKSCFDRTPLSREVIEAQVKLEQLEKERPSIIQERDEIKFKYDSLLSDSRGRSGDLEKQKTPIQYVIKKIPVIIDNLDREQLRRAYAGYNLP